jgi:SAM-dependent methyltransferase
MSVSNDKSPVHGAPLPSVWVGRWLRGGRRGARVLDFACGGGRHAHLALAAGAHVTAADRDPRALARLDPAVVRIEADLEADPWPFEPSAFDVVICCNYLFRARLDLLFGLVAPGGRLIYETFACGNERYGRPASAAFLLRPAELLQACARNGFEVVAYEHGYVPAPKPAVVQRVCATRPPTPVEDCPLVG